MPQSTQLAFEWDTPALPSAPSAQRRLPNAPATQRATPRHQRIARAAGELRLHFANGSPITRHTLKRVMRAHFTPSGPQRAEPWLWKEAYDAAEIALTLHLLALALGEERNLGYETLRALNTLEPPHTHRSTEQIDRQQFSTPLLLAYAAARALALRPEDRLLEPSAGTATLAAVAIATCEHTHRARVHLNELATLRAQALRSALAPQPRFTFSEHNAEHIAEHLPREHFHAIIMNPPFSRLAGAGTRHRDAALVHIRSAAATLAPGARLVAITAANQSPEQPRWHALLGPHQIRARLLASAPVDGRLYAARGTRTSSRLNVFERPLADDAPVPTPVLVEEEFQNYPSLLRWIDSALGPRLAATTPEAPAPITPLEPKPDKPKTTKRRAAPAAHRYIGHGQPLTYATPRHVATTHARVDHRSYSPWEPEVVKIENARGHPNALVQTAAMSALPAPIPSTRPLLPPQIVEDGTLSDAQLESIVLACESHARHLAGTYAVKRDGETLVRVDSTREGAPHAPDLTEIDPGVAPFRLRRGYLIGDGTGCGKGRQVTAVILERWLAGSRRALWLSQSTHLIADARRDWKALGGDPADIIDLSKLKSGSHPEQPQGILFSTYATLRQPPKQHARSRLDQIVDWLAHVEPGTSHQDRTAAHRRADPVIVFDESHAMANAAPPANEGRRAKRLPSKQGKAGLALQRTLPDARVLYVSATGATTLAGLAYAERLGLWGSDETPFENRLHFMSEIHQGGLAAMEIVARDLKALGLYQARALSYHGVEVEPLEHTLSEAQRELYDTFARAFLQIHNNIECALEACQVTFEGKTLSSAAKSAALSAFESTKQRFFSHLLTAMKCPTLIASMERDLERGLAPIVQITSTGEAVLSRRLEAHHDRDPDDLGPIDTTPREYVISYLKHAFPVRAHQLMRDEDGNLYAEAITNADGTALHTREAIERRDELITKIGLMQCPGHALDQIIHHFGDENVAEITGRSKRIVACHEAHRTRYALRPRSAHASTTEADEFLEGKRKVLVFSLAGATGRSYHAGLEFANQSRRVHYLLEPGWQAHIAVQGLGRSHRTNQASAPLFRPVITDVRGERRFISTIVKRLDTLGAITRGQRDAQSGPTAGDEYAPALRDETPDAEILDQEQRSARRGGRLFDEADDLENEHAHAALRTLYHDLVKSRVRSWTLDHFERVTALRLTDHEGNLAPTEKLPPMSRFLNRLLAMTIDEQNTLFGELEQRIHAQIDKARKEGTLDRGVELIRAKSLKIENRSVLTTHPRVRAATELIEIQRTDPLYVRTSADALERAARYRRAKPRRCINARSGRVALALILDADDAPYVVLVRPTSSEHMELQEFNRSHWKRADPEQWEHAWSVEHDRAPTEQITRLWVATGLLLPLWSRLPYLRPAVRKMRTDCGTAIIGRLLSMEEARMLAASYDTRNAVNLDPETVWKAILEDSTRFELLNGWELRAQRVMDDQRVRLTGPGFHETSALKRMGFYTEVLRFDTALFAPDAKALQALLEAFPLAPARPAQKRKPSAASMRAT